VPRRHATSLLPSLCCRARTGLVREQWRIIRATSIPVVDRQGESVNEPNHAREVINIPYGRVQESRLYEEVAGQIRQRILSGDILPDTKLPPVHTLAREFGVSRTVVREAIQSLQSSGLVSVRHGSGVFVSEPTVAAVTEMLQPILQFRNASVYDLHEVREILETAIASLAAQRAIQEEKVELLRVLEQMESTLEAPKEYVKADLLFHAILAKATRNEVFLLLLQPLVEFLVQSRTRAAQAPGGTVESLRGHRAIFEAVSEGDHVRAKETMREHLSEVRRRLTASDTIGQS
jgi:GntR family transcriptional repressor for pyruvate dehydrogenase complex